MSRSYKKTHGWKIAGINSEKFDKQKWHRGFRLKNRFTCYLIKNKVKSCVIYPLVREFVSKHTFNGEFKTIWFNKDTISWSNGTTETYKYQPIVRRLCDGKLRNDRKSRHEWIRK